MPPAVTVLLKIVTISLVILVGWIARRRDVLSAEVARAMSRFVVDVTFPALVFTKLLSTVDAVSLSAGWYVPIYAALIIVTAELVGLAIMGLFARGHERPTFVFLVSIPNWFYLPYPIVAALYGDEGVVALLLANVGMQFVLWSLGVWTVRGGRPDLASLKALATNGGLIATVLGVAFACLVPWMGGLEKLDLATAGAGEAVLSVFVQALAMLGALTVPVSFLIMGIQLGGLTREELRPSRAVAGTVLGRQVLSPLVVVILVALAARAGLAMAETPRVVGYLVASMPIGVSCAIFAERYGGDVVLAPRAIFYSTLTAVVTVPLLFWLVQTLGL